MSNEIRRECNKCHVVKPLDLFYGDRTKTLGKSYMCKECHDVRYKTQRYPKIKTQDNYKAKQKRNKSKWRASNPEKIKAHTLAKDIPLPKACESCGAEPKHRHHPDYSKPLEVIALCVDCHEAVHHRNLSV